MELIIHAVARLYNISSLCIVFFLIEICGHSCVSSASKNPVVLVVSTDGFRYDYVEDCLTPSIVALREKGVYAPYMKNVFPTKTFPNHHSIATGVYPEVHGVLDSSVYLIKDGCVNGSVVHYGYDLYHYDNDVIPIWTLNQLASKDRHSGVMMWPGGEFPYGCKKTRPTFSQAYDLNITFHQRIDTVISWLSHKDTPANLVMLYLQEPDLHSHAFGVDSNKVREQIKKVDGALNYLAQQLAAHNLNETVNVFVVSDHGMTSIHQQNIIDLDKFVDNTSYVLASQSPVLQIVPHQGKEEAVILGLQEARQKHRNMFDVYKRSEIPPSWHYAHNNRTPPILVVAKEGYVFQDFKEMIKYYNNLFNIEPSPTNQYGLHGYSNEILDMYPIFFAWGPQLKSGFKMDPFNSVDLYPTWAYLLNLELPELEYSSPITSLFPLKEIVHHTKPSSNPLLRGANPNTFSKEIVETSSVAGTSSASTWVYWLTGMIAFAILVAIISIIVYYFRDIRFGTSPVPVLPTYSRVESQHLLLSDSEEEETKS